MNIGFKLTGGVLLAAALAVACTKETPFESRTGQVISFGVSTGFDNGPETRTEYSGALVTSNGSSYERINWVPGTDRIQVFCDEANDVKKADYKIESAEVGDDARNSDGTVLPAGSDKLTWGLSGDHYFFALYPAATMSGVTASEAVLEKHATENHKATVKGRIPAIQEVTWDASKREYKPSMKYAYMYAAVKVSPSSARSVSLPFKPLMTAFEFTLKLDPYFPVGSNLTKVELTAATNLSGSFTATLDKDGLSEISSVSGAGTTLTLNLGTGVALNASNAVKFTFLALPVKQENLTLRLTFANGLTRALELKNGSEFIEVEPCMKLYISNITPPGLTYYDMSTIADITISDEYVLDDNARAVTVNTEKDGFNGYTGTDRDLRKTPWKAYYVDGSKSRPAKGTVINSDYSATPVSWLNVTSGGSGAGKDDSFGFTIAGAPLIGAKVLPSACGKAMIDKLQGKNLGTIDLSRRNFLESSTYSTAETANCYIVDGYGTFLIPLVYGNAIQNGSVNTSAYQGRATSASNKYLRDFLNADGNAIQSAYILQDNGLSKTAPYNGCVVWQDTQKTFEIVKDSDISILTTKPSAGAVNCAYLQFRIRQENIKPGNVVIALRDASNKILWSWHIWVRANITKEQVSSVDTDANRLQAREVLYFKNPGIIPSGRAHVYILSEPLGYTPPLSYQGGHTDARSVWVAIVSQETNAVLGSFKVTQNSYTQEGIDVTSANIYSATYYQWGRKDPFLPTDGVAERSKIATSSAGYTIRRGANGVPTESFSSNGPSMISRGIQNPWLFNTNYNNSLVDSYRNLWDIDNNQANTGDIEDAAVNKTIYDPSPRGFSVIRSCGFTGGTNGGTNRDNEINIYATYVDPGASGWNPEWPAGRKMSVDNISINPNRDYKVFIPAVGWRGFNSGIVSYRYEGDAATTFGKGYNMYYWTASPTDTRQNNYPETPNRIQAASFHAASDLFHPRSRDCRTDGFPILCAHD